MKFKGGNEPRSRRRQDPDDMHRKVEEIIRRHRAGESVRRIAAAVGLPRTSLHRIIQRHRAENSQQNDDDKNDSDTEDFSSGNGDDEALAWTGMSL